MSCEDIKFIIILKILPVYPKLHGGATGHYCFLLALDLFTMSALPPPPQDLPKTNQFIRPTSPFDVVSSAQRLVLRGPGFSGSAAYTEAVSRGLVTEFADVLVTAWGGVPKMCNEDAVAILDLYCCAGVAQEVPPSTAEAGGDVAAGSPASSTAAAYSKN
jgi:hypothetical protein